MSNFWEFDSYVEGGDEDFNSYVERFEHYWKVTQMEDSGLKKSAFITALGKRPYRTLKDLLLPAKPDDKSFEDLVSVLKEHYAPGSQVIADRFKFNRRQPARGNGHSAAPKKAALLNGEFGPDLPVCCKLLIGKFAQFTASDSCFHTRQYWVLSGNFSKLAWC
ncbi:hypothetical protein MTO96_025249 [Rhipicephalus appendiculatus]